MIQILITNNRQINHVKAALIVRKQKLVIKEIKKGNKYKEAETVKDNKLTEQIKW